MEKININSGPISATSASHSSSPNSAVNAKTKSLKSVRSVSFDVPTSAPIENLRRVEDLKQFRASIKSIHKSHSVDFEDNFETLTAALTQKGDSSKLNPQTVLLDAHLAGYMYEKNLTKLNQIVSQNSAADWQISTTLISELASSVELNFVNDEHRSMMIGQKTGLTATVLVNSTTKEIYLIFGGTSTGQTESKEGSPGIRSFRNIGITTSQWKTNFRNVFSNKVPGAYQQAAQLATNLKKYIENSASGYNGYKLKMVGHSLGGGLATYAAAMAGSADKPITANCFASAELGLQAIKAICEQHANNTENLRAIFSAITHIRIQSDVVSLISRLNVSSAIKALKLLGTTYTLPKSPNKHTVHDTFRYHVREWARVS